jgi:PAS domain S-box-containing protein
MKLTLKKKITISLLLGFAVLLITGFLSYKINSALIESTENISQAHQLTIHLENLLVLITDGETGVRGYVITGDSIYLEPYINVLGKIDDERKYLSKLPEKKDKTGELDSLIAAKLHRLEYTIGIRNRLGFEGALNVMVDKNEGKILMDKIRKSIGELKIKEENLVALYDGKIQKAKAETIVIIPTVTLIAIIIVVIGIFVISKEITSREAAEKKLRISETNLGNAYDLRMDLYNNAPCGYQSLDRNGLIVEINNTELKWLGYDRCELVDKIKFPDLMADSSNAERFEANYALFISTGKANDLRYELKRKDGSTFPVSLNATAIYDSSGRFIRSRATMTDISKRKKAEDAAAESRAWLQAIVDYSPTAIYLTDLDGRFLMVNKHAELLLGKSSNQIIGKNSHDFYSKEIAEKFDENNETVMKSGKALELEEESFSAGGKHTFISFRFPIYDANNKIFAICGISTDITARKRAEQRFIALLDSAPVAIVIVNEKGEIELVSAESERLFGYSKKELIGQNVELLMPGEFRNAYLDRRDDFLENIIGGSMEIELFGKRKDGTKFPVEISLSPLETEEGVRVSAAIRDITDRKNTEKNLKGLNQALLSSNGELESFSYSVSHDLRAPLRHIVGFGEKLQKKLNNSNDPEDNRLVGKITAAADKMARLIDDLLKFSRVGRTELEKRNLDLNSLVHEIIEENKDGEGDKNIEWKIDKLQEVFADPLQLKIVFTNLISNAVKYTSKKENRIIEIGQNADGAENVFFVKDNGAGFDMKYSSKLFGVFQRLHGDNEYEGTGIGLATVRRIVNRHGGRIWAASETNKGATFYFTISNN